MNLTLNNKQLSNAAMPAELRGCVSHFEGRCDAHYIRTSSWGSIRNWARKKARQHLTPTVIALMDSESYNNGLNSFIRGTNKPYNQGR